MCRNGKQARGCPDQNHYIKTNRIERKPAVYPRQAKGRGDFGDHYRDNNFVNAVDVVFLESFKISVSNEMKRGVMNQLNNPNEPCHKEGREGVDQKNEFR